MPRDAFLRRLEDAYFDPKTGRRNDGRRYFVVGDTTPGREVGPVELIRLHGLDWRLCVCVSSDGYSLPQALEIMGRGLTRIDARTPRPNSDVKAGG